MVKRKIMKNVSIDKFYAKQIKHLLLITGFTEIKDLEVIIKICRLKPEVYLNNEPMPLIPHKWWIDEFHNSLKFVNKKPVIIYNDLNINREVVTTDIYYGLPIEKIVKFSKLMYIYFGQDEDLNDTCGIITFWGIDGYLRSFMYMYGEWIRVSPLLLGFKHLQNLVKNKNTQLFKNCLIKEKPAVPCSGLSRWLSCMPVDHTLVDGLNRKYNGLFSFLKD